MKKISYGCIFILICAVLLLGWGYHVKDELKNNIVRLHVIANSDSEADQNIKLAVRDGIIDLANKMGHTPNATQLKTEAERILNKEGASYTAKVTYGEYYVNRRQYQSFILPQGIYTAARVELGEAKGKNWWCVLSPPLCFTKSALGDTDELTKFLDSETTDAVKGITVKLKILEWMTALSEK